MASGLGLDHDDRRGARAERAEEPEVLVGRRHDLVARLEVEAADDDRAALGGGARERHLRRIGVDEARERLTGLVPQRDRLLEVRQAASAVLGVVLDRLHERVRDGARERPERARVEVGDPLEHGEERAGLLEGHDVSVSMRASTTGWSESTTPSCTRCSRGHATTDSTRAPRTRT